MDKESNIKLADFGLSYFMRDGKHLHTMCGSLNYAAPELISGKPYCGTEVDVWSMGIVLFVMLSGSLPFEGFDVSTVISRIVCKIYSEGKYEIPYYVSPLCRDLIYRMLAVDPVERITVH